MEHAIEKVLQKWEDAQLPCLQTLETRQLIADVRAAYDATLEQMRQEGRAEMYEELTGDFYMFLHAFGIHRDYDHDWLWHMQRALKKASGS